MRNGKWIKVLVVGIIMLFIGTSVLPNTSGSLGEITKSNSNSLNQISYEKTNFNIHLNPSKTLNLTDGLVCYWNFDEGTGSIAHDSSGNGYDGIIHNATWTTGKNGSALEIKNTNYVGDISSSYDDSITTDLTVAAWIKWYGPNSYLNPCIIFDGRGNPGQGFIFRIDSSGDNNNLVFWLNDNAGVQLCRSISSIPIGSWTHVAAVFDHSSNVCRLYINGSLDNSSTITQAFSQSSFIPVIGNNHWLDGNWGPLNGIGDEVRIYNRTLNDIEIRQLAEVNQPPIFGTPSPANNSVNTSINFTWNIPIADPEGDLITWAIQCNNGQISTGYSEPNGTKSLVLTNLAYLTSYIVWVNATDPMGSQIFVDTWYTFKTKAPSVPPVFGTPTPVNGSNNILNSFSWAIPISDPDGDLFTWTIQCSNGQNSSGTNAGNGTKSLPLSDLVSSTTYKVWVNATDPAGSNLYTRAWYTFTTQQNFPPNQPSKPSGNASGKINTLYTYTTSTIDPNGDHVYYNWSWGDGNYSGWLGPYNSGITTNATHKWTVKGSYSIKVKAKDTYGLESNWSDPLSVTMPLNNLFSLPSPLSQFLELLFERFPNAFPILRHLLGY